MEKPKPINDYDLSRLKNQRAARKLAIRNGVRQASTIAGLVTVGILVFQTLIMWRQAVIMEHQDEISRQQKELMATQLNMSVRPGISIQVSSNDYNSSIPWCIKNTGSVSIRILRSQPVWFSFYEGRGWHVNASAGGLPPENLAPNVVSKSMDLATLVKEPMLVKDIDQTQEYFVMLVWFDRLADGKSFVLIDPYFIDRRSKQLWHESESSFSGPLSRTKPYGALPLALEFLRRDPLMRPAELYNYSSDLVSTKYKSTDDIFWIDKETTH